MKYDNIVFCIESELGVVCVIEVPFQEIGEELAGIEIKAHGNAIVWIRGVFHPSAQGYAN